MATPDVPRTKLSGLSNLNVQALHLVFDEGIESTATTATIIGRPQHVLSAVLRFMDAERAKGNTRQHPLASLHAVVRKLRKAAEAESPAEDSRGQEEAPVAEESPLRESIQDAVAAGRPVPHEDELSVPADHPVRVKWEAEVADLQRQWDKLEADLHSIQAEYDAAWGKERKYEFDSIPPQVAEESDRLSKQLLTVMEQQRNVRQALDRVSVPAELERRLQDANYTAASVERIKKMAAEKPAKQTARELGVPDIYLSESGNFIPGKDARYKSDLVNSALGISTPEMAMTFEPNDAEVRLQARGWMGFLTRKREILAAKAAKAEATKAAKPAAKKATAKPKADATEVKPDPKPASTKGTRRGGRLSTKKS